MRLTPEGRRVLAEMLEELLSHPDKGSTAKRLCMEIGFDWESFLQSTEQRCQHRVGGEVKGGTDICNERLPCLFHGDLL